MLPHATEWTLSRGISLSFYGFLFVYDGVHVLVKITHRDKSACEIRLVRALAVYTHLKTSVIIIYTLTQTYGKLFLYLFNVSSERVIRNMMKYKYIFILHFEICHCVIKKCIQWLSRYTNIFDILSILLQLVQEWVLHMVAALVTGHSLLFRPAQ